ncbi:toll-like receptor 13 [Brachyhypopomus gauderio]|uniref:toll-like receptor 13 n=1 Tax=Brachyhypopomus gauderio TaxID=698409 RepID=UPI00404133C6
MLHNLTKLEILILQNCRIDVLDGSLTKDLKSLIEITLILEPSVTIFSSFVENLIQLKFLYVWRLNVLCSCSNAWIVPWSKNSEEVIVQAFNPPMEELKCSATNGTNHLDFAHYTEEVCYFEKEFVLFVSTSLSVITFVLAVLVQRFAGSYLTPLYHIVHGWLWEALGQDGKRHYRYDAFVSYSGKDEGWVVEQLLPNLERRGPLFLRLCLHSRDFPVGQDIVENITDSLYSSRWTLCLVSRSYLRSAWCSLELQLATCRLQVEQRDVLILVFLEKVPSRLLSAHHRLARLLKTRTYLAWPEDAEQHTAFWDKIWDKLKPETGDQA